MAASVALPLPKPEAAHRGSFLWRTKTPDRSRSRARFFAKLALVLGCIMRGRKPTPTVLKIVNGNPGKRPLNDKEPAPKRQHLDCPPFLDDDAKNVWDALVPELDRLGLLTVVDRGQIAAYCQAWAEFRIATEMVQAEGRTVIGGSGGIKPHPAIAMQRSAWKAILSFSALFGLDPSSRCRLKVQPDQQADPLNEFLAK